MPRQMTKKPITMVIIEATGARMPLKRMIVVTMVKKVKMT